MTEEQFNEWLKSLNSCEVNIMYMTEKDTELILEEIEEEKEKKLKR